MSAYEQITSPDYWANTEQLPGPMQQNMGTLAIRAARGYQQVEDNFMVLQSADVRAVMIQDGESLPGKLADDRPSVLRLVLDQVCSTLVQRPTYPLTPEAFDVAAERLTDRWYTGDGAQTVFSNGTSEYVATRSVVYARPVFDGFQYGVMKSLGVDPTKRQSREDFGKVNADPRMQLPPMVVGQAYGGGHLDLGFAMRIHSALQISALNVPENSRLRDGHTVRSPRIRFFGQATSQA